MQELSAIVLCNDRISLPALQALAFHGRLTAICIPERNKETIEEIRESLPDITILELKKKEWKEQVKTKFRETGAQVGLLMTFPWILEKELIETPARGFFNFHYGLLPQYRGSDPIFFQIKNREPFAGLTIHRVVVEMDAGPVVMLEKIQLKADTTYGFLKARLAQLGAVMATNFFKLLSFTENIPSRSQDESLARWYVRPSAKDVMIRWKEMNADEILATIHACNPWNKGAGAIIKGLGIRILGAELVEEKSNENIIAGTIVSVNSGTMEVQTADHRLLRLNWIYIPEAFMNPSRLTEFGINTGDLFD